MRAMLGLLLAPTLAAADCPPGPDLGTETAALILELRSAPDPGAAAPIMAELWRVWTIAPDEVAQDLLDDGMDRRETYDLLGARAIFDRLVAYCPNYAEGWNQRAFASFLGRDYEAALADLDRALALNPTHVGALSGRALALMGLGRVDEGQAALRDALAVNPWLAERALLIEPPGEDI